MLTLASFRFSLTWKYVVFLIRIASSRRSNECTHYTIININKKITRIYFKFNNVCSYGVFFRTQERVWNSRGNEPLVFEPLKFYCISFLSNSHHEVLHEAQRNESIRRISWHRVCSWPLQVVEELNWIAFALLIFHVNALQIYFTYMGKFTNAQKQTL